MGRGLVRTSPVFTLAILTACGPWCGTQDFRPSPAQETHLLELLSAGRDYARALASGEPETRDAAHFKRMMDAAEAYLTVGGGPEARGALAARVSAEVQVLSGEFSDLESRTRAAERALRGFRLFVLPAHPEAALHLP